MATHSSILVWEISRTEEPGRLQSMRSQRAGHDRATEYADTHWQSQVIQDDSRKNVRKVGVVRVGQTSEKNFG